MQTEPCVFVSNILIILCFTCARNNCDQKVIASKRKQFNNKYKLDAKITCFGLKL